MVVCLEQDADLHIAQLMPLPLTGSCFSKIQIGFTFLVPAHLGSPGKRAVKRACACVCEPTDVRGFFIVSGVESKVLVMAIIIIIIIIIAKSAAVCLSACICLRKPFCLELHVRSSPDFCCMLLTLFWRRCDTSCTSGLWITSYFT